MEKPIGGGSHLMTPATTRRRLSLRLLAAFVCTLAAVLAVAVPARADDVTITINDQQPTGSTENGPTYDWYVMMWASVADGQSGQANAISYHVDKQTLATALGNLHVTDSGWSTEAPGENDAKLFTVTRVNDQDYWTVVINKKADNTDYTGEEVAAALSAVVSGKTGTGLDEVTEQHGHVNASTNETKTFIISQNGYVLINSSLGSKSVLDSFQTKTVNEKNEYPTVDKTQSKTSTGTFSKDDISAEIGKTVYYQLKIEVPKTANQKIEVYDVISKGLTLNMGSDDNKPVTLTSVKVNDTDVTWGTGETSPINNTYSWTDVTPTGSSAPTDGSKTYKFEIPEDVVKLIASKAVETTSGTITTHHPAYITLTYTATVNEDAVMQDPWNTNESYIKYDNYTSVHSKVTTKVFKFDLEKRIENINGELLPGVKFTLTRTEGSGESAQTLYYTSPSDSSNNTEARFVALNSGESVDAKKLTTDSNGKITFAGLAAGTYTLTETDTVSGYRGLAQPITITVDENGGISSTSLSSQSGSQIGSISNNNLIIVINQRGSVLPSTGGAGTVAFYVIGGALMAGAVVLAVSKKRASAK